MERGEPKGSLFASCKETACLGGMGKRRDDYAQNATIVQDFAEICCYTIRKKGGKGKMASFVTHFLNVMFRHMPIIEDTEEERRKNAARPLLLTAASKFYMRSF